MDYEAFRDDYVALAAKLKAQMDTQQKLFKRIAKNVDAGDVRSAVRDFESFQTSQFEATDLALIAGNKGKNKAPVLDADVYLNTLYKFLVPMARFRKDYDARAYAFDLARLYSAADVSLPDGRKLQFGPSRNNNRAIRILDAYENELFIATVRFYHD